MRAAVVRGRRTYKAGAAHPFDAESELRAEQPRSLPAFTARSCGRPGLKPRAVGRQNQWCTMNL